MVVAKDNPDGWGIAWWSGSDPAPHRYRTTVTAWEDTTFAHCDATATAVLAAVRKASPSTTLREVNNAPFVAETRIGPIAFSLNGFAFRDGSEHRLRALVRPQIAIDGDTDSEVLFALLRQAIDDGTELPAALAAVHQIAAPAPDAYVNLLAVTAHQIAATTWNHTLYVRETDAGTDVASEPLDADPGWNRVPDAQLVAATDTNVTLVPLEGFR